MSGTGSSDFVYHSSTRKMKSDIPCPLQGPFLSLSSCAKLFLAIFSRIGGDAMCPMLLLNGETIERKQRCGVLCKHYVHSNGGQDMYRFKHAFGLTKWYNGQLFKHYFQRRKFKNFNDYYLLTLNAVEFLSIQRIVQRVHSRQFKTARDFSQELMAFEFEFEDWLM